MAENENGQEKTEEPTQKKLDKAKEDGQVPRSKELNTTLVLVGGVSGLLLIGNQAATSLLNIMRFNFSLSDAQIYDDQLLMHHLYDSLTDAALAIAPLMIFLSLAAFIGPVMISGLNFSAKSLKPKFNKLNPLSGIKRMFSKNSLVELVKAIAKFFLVAGVAFLVLKFLEAQIMVIDSLAIEVGIKKSVKLIVWSALAISAATVVIAAVDVPYQIFENNKKLKMTLQEVKDEMKDSEGKPEVKGRIRQVQMEMAQRRMMESVPDADVVITNPEHFSVALKYDVDGSGAPILLAKGVDHMAFRIRELAKNNNIELLEAPPLARAIYFTTEIDQEIPDALYMAVAQVLVYVFQLKTFKEGKGAKPMPLGKIAIPKEAQYGADGKLGK